MTGDWLRGHESAGELALPGPASSSAVVIFLSTLSGSVAKRVVPSSDRLCTDGAVALAGDRASSRASPVPTDSGESLQADIRSTSGGQVRVEITSATEVGWSLGVGIGGRSTETQSRHRTAKGAPRGGKCSRSIRTVNRGRESEVFKSGGGPTRLRWGHASAASAGEAPVWRPETSGVKIIRQVHGAQPNCYNHR